MQLIICQKAARTFIPSVSTGWCSHLHDLYHRSAYCVCGHRADLQRPAQPQCPRRGQRPDEGLSGCMFCCLFIVANKANSTFATLPWDVPALLACISHRPVPPLYFITNEELKSCTGLYSHSKGQMCSLKDRTLYNKARGAYLLFLSNLGQIKKVPHFSLSFETTKSHLKDVLADQMDLVCKCHQFTDLYSKDLQNFPCLAFQSVFPSSCKWGQVVKACCMSYSSSCLCLRKA